MDCGRSVKWNGFPLNRHVNAVLLLLMHSLLFQLQTSSAGILVGR